MTITCLGLFAAVGCMVKGIDMSGQENGYSLQLVLTRQSYAG